MWIFDERTISLDRQTRSGETGAWSARSLDLMRCLKRAFQYLDLQTGQFRRGEINSFELRPELEAGERDSDLDGVFTISGIRQRFPDQGHDARLDGGEKI